MNSLLVLNAGSSSVRVGLFDAVAPRQSALRAKLDRIHSEGCRLSIEATPSRGPTTELLEAPLAESLLDWLEERDELGSVQAVGHRIVHGLQRSDPEWVTPALMQELNRIRPYAPEHLPREISFIEAVTRRRADLPQLVCFDTSFHRTMPRVATLMAIPRHYEQEGIQRYGFHGLSCAFLLEALAALEDPAASQGRVILAHLGNGASLTAVRDGQSVDTSMGFTPVSGLPMGTRSGDLDPGLFGHLADRGGMTPAQFDWMVNHESGLLGVSGLSSDMHELLAQESENPRAADAVNLFCYQARKGIGSFAAVLGGLDTLVFAGGIGENEPEVRSRICSGLGFLGIDLDRERNTQAPGIISSASSRVMVRVIQTDEASMIARLTYDHLRLAPRPAR